MLNAYCCVVFCTMYCRWSTFALLSRSRVSSLRPVRHPSNIYDERSSRHKQGHTRRPLYSKLQAKSTRRDCIPLSAAPVQWRNRAASRPKGARRRVRPSMNHRFLNERHVYTLYVPPAMAVTTLLYSISNAGWQMRRIRRDFF